MSLLPLLLITTFPALALEEITIDPTQQTGATVQYFGWDLKEWKNNAATIKKAEILYKENPANIVRIPLIGLAHNRNGSVNEDLYGPLLDSIENIKDTNPKVKIFASLKLKKGDTFPSWVESNKDGKIFNTKVKCPDPKLYAKLIADYIVWLKKHGIVIDFLGINNEVSNALTPERYIDTIKFLMEEIKSRKLPEEYRSFKFVAGEGFGIPTSIRNVELLKKKRLLNYGHIFGSHFYPDLESGSIEDWEKFAQISPSSPTWQTELHIRDSDEPTRNINKVRDSLALLFKVNQAGAEGFIWWAGTPNEKIMTNLIRQKIIISMLKGSCIKTSGRYLAKNNVLGKELVQATRVDDTVWLWYFNPGEKRDSISISLQNRQMKKQSGEYWAGGKVVTNKTHGRIKITSATESSFEVTDIPASSIVLIKIKLKEEKLKRSPKNRYLVAEREWTSASQNSKKVRATLVSVKNAIGYFRRNNGSDFSYPLEKLSTTDQQIIKRALAK